MNLKIEDRIKEALKNKDQVIETKEGVNMDRDFDMHDSNPEGVSYRDEMMKITFEEYKMHCYNAWRFKNILVNLEELNINLAKKHEYDNIIKHLRGLITLGAIQVKIETAGSRDRDEYYKIFKPFLNLLEMLAFITLGSKKISVSKDQLEEVD